MTQVIVFFNVCSLSFVPYEVDMTGQVRSFIKFWIWYIAINYFDLKKRYLQTVRWILRINSIFDYTSCLS